MNDVLLKICYVLIIVAEWMGSRVNTSPLYTVEFVNCLKTERPTTAFVCTILVKIS